MTDDLCVKLRCESHGSRFLHQDARIQNLYISISELNLSITSLFSVQIMSYLGPLDIIYSVVIDSFISEILKYESSVIQSLAEKT